MTLQEEIANKVVNNKNLRILLICKDPKELMKEIKQHIPDMSILTKNNITEIITKDDSMLKVNSLNCSICATKGITWTNIYVIGEIEEHIKDEFIQCVYPVVKASKGEMHFIPEIKSK